MKAHLLAFLFLLGLTVPAFADKGEPAPFKRSFSLEIGAGHGPYHMFLRNVSPSWKAQKALAQEGLVAKSDGVFYPAFSLSGVWRYAYRWEAAFTGGVSWSHHPVIQYDTFGLDPQGNPRYDLNKGHSAGWRDSTPVGTLTFQARVFWNPEWLVQAYSAFGFGFTTASEIIPIPAVTPLGLRYGGKHFYFFVETPLNPVALFLHGGLGWRF